MKKVSNRNRKKMEQFSKENSADTNVFVNGTHSIPQEMSNDSCSMILSSHEFSGSNLNKILKPEECAPTYQCHKLGGYFFVDVGSDLVRSDYLLEEDNNICKVSSKNLFIDNKDIDYNLFKNVKINRCLEDSDKENEITQNLETSVFSVNDICNVSDKFGLPTNACIEKMYKNIDNYDKKPSIDCATTSTVVSASGSADTINAYIKENVLVHQSTDNISPEIKKEEVGLDEELSIIDESIIDIKLHAVNKIEEPSDINTNNSWILDESNKSGFTVLSKTVNSNVQESYTICSDEVPGNSHIDSVMVCKPSKETETLQSKMKSHQSKVQTLSGTCSELQVKLKINSRDDSDEDGVEECNNKLSEAYVNTEAKSISDEMCQHQRSGKSKHITDRRYVCKACCKAFTQLSNLKAHKRIHTGDRPFHCTVCGKAFPDYSALRKHERIHTGNKPFGCSICGKAFTHNFTLKRHIRIHTGERPFHCNVCGKTFTQQRSLKEHKLLHTGERPFNCSTCNKAFTNNFALKNHSRIHTGDNHFDCSTCGKAFTHLATLKKHKFLIHSSSH